MREAYKETMDRIVVTEKMRDRILHRICSEEPLEPKKSPMPRWTRGMAAAACLALLVAGAVTIPNLLPRPQTENPPGIQTGIWERKEAASLEELSRLVGFEVEEAADLPFQVTETLYMAYGSELAEVRYSGEGESVVFRKTVGDTDPSGDYTAYSDCQLLELGDRTITVKGDSGEYRLAVWQEEGYSYSVASSTAYSSTQWLTILDGIG